MKEKQKWETPKLGNLDLKNTAASTGGYEDASMLDSVVPYTS